MTLSQIIPICFPTVLNYKLNGKKWTLCKLRGLERTGRIRLMPSMGIYLEIPTEDQNGRIVSTTYPVRDFSADIAWSENDNRGSESQMISRAKQLIENAINSHDFELYNHIGPNKAYVLKSHRYHLGTPFQYSFDSGYICRVSTILAIVP